jgi:hypothetical protein
LTLNRSVETRRLAVATLKEASTPERVGAVRPIAGREGGLSVTSPANMTYRTAARTTVTITTTRTIAMTTGTTFVGLGGGEKTQGPGTT